MVTRPILIFAPPPTAGADEAPPDAGAEEPPAAALEDELELDPETDHQYQLAVSTQWALRLSVLMQLGVEPVALRKRLSQHQRFLLALANMDRCDTRWAGSRLDDFLAVVAGEQDEHD